MARLDRTTPRFILAGLLLWLVPSAASAAPLSPAEVPEPLQAWVPWVLRDVPGAACPYVHASTQERRCSWPSRLELALGDTRGEFVQDWLVHETAWVPLPGDDKRWPQEVKVGEQPAVVQIKDGRPGLELSPGTYRVSGAFLWDSLPEKLQVPAETGLLALKIRGEAVVFPQRDNAGVLWLQKRAEEGAEENLLDVVVHRKIADTIPLMVTTQIEVQAAGKNREVLLGKALLANFVPMAVRSELPARLEADGRLRLQIRPGRWVIEIDARHPGPVPQLKLETSEGPWASEEIWAFAAEPALRRVELSGVTSVDPQQTLLPEDWKRLPAYRVRPGEAMLLAETHRGQIERGPDQLTLERTWWLDFDGRGFSVRDWLRGEVYNTRRLEVHEPAQLGYAAAQGRPQFITALTPEGQPGVELRSSTLDLRTDMRVPAGGLKMTLSAVDWDQDFAQVSGLLHLPPGWRLLHATGVDEVGDTWLQRWTLLDIFLVMVIAVAIGRLFGWAWGTLAVVTLALVFPEWMAPRSVWIFVLVGEALLRVLPVGRARSLVAVYRVAALTVMAGVVIAFTVQQIRGGLYPALEVRNDHDSFGFGVLGGARDHAPMVAEQSMAPAEYREQDDKNLEAPMGYAEAEDQDESKPGRYGMKELKSDADSGDAEPQQWQQESGKMGKSSSSSRQSTMRKQQKLREYDANTVVQTGSGVPGWTWRTVHMRWNGPVTRDQQVQLYLLAPQINLALAFIRVLFLLTLVLAVFGVLGRRRHGPPASGARVGAAGALLLALGASLAAPTSASAAELPGTELLDQLRARLTEAPSCLPSCVTSSRMRIEATEKGLRLVQELHVSAPVGVPLPGTAEQWLPSSVLVDGLPPRGGLVRASDGTLAIELAPGRHELVLEGPLPARETVQLALPLKPHRVEAKATGWTVDGIHEDGLADDNLQLTRLSPQDASEAPSELEVGTLPPFVRLERSLQLGLQWELTTRVVRLSPRGAAVVLGVPLLPGESVTSAEQRVEGGKVLVNMAPEQGEHTWTSVLPITEQVLLRATQGEPWTEQWQVEVGPVWHVEHTGLPTVRQGEAGLREWRPWPGEQVMLTVTRPQGVPGQTLTIDSAALQLQPGVRAVDAHLVLALRSSRGGHHVVQIPVDALLQEVTINGVRQTIGQEGRMVRLPIEPGNQTIDLSWREPHELWQRYAAPVIDLGAPAVNATVTVDFPQNRWILLLGGPRLGPAVLFWSFVLMLLIVAAALSRLRWTPLRGHQWFLLGIGLSPIPVPMAMIVVGWFLALAWRRDHPGVSAGWFSLRQLILVGWTIAACVTLTEAIRMGLLGQPDMQIEGNGSYSSHLVWYQDRVEDVEGVGSLLPRPWVLSVSMWWYRGLMLAWALWLAGSLIRWLPWAWGSFSAGGVWRRLITPASSAPPSPPVRPLPAQGSGPMPSHASVAPTSSGHLSSAQTGLAHTSSVSEAIFATSGNSLVGEPPLVIPPLRSPGPGDTLPHAQVVAPVDKHDKHEKTTSVSVSPRPLAGRRVPPPPVRGPGPRREPLELTPDDDDEHP